MMTPSFRIDAAQMRAWHAEAALRVGLRGVAAVAKEMEVALAKATDGHVVVTRHQVFTWAEALQGAATRDAAAAGTLGQVVADMRAVLSGREKGEGRRETIAPPSLAPLPSALPAQSPSSPPPVVYARQASASSPSSLLPSPFVSGAALGEEIRKLIASARHEVCVIAPWGLGLDSLIDPLVMAPADARVLVVSRRPEREDEAFHRGMAQLSKRGVVTAFSPLLQTRMVVVDGERALVGAASLPAPGGPSREAAALLDGAAAKAARDHFARVFTEAGGSTG